MSTILYYSNYCKHSKQLIGVLAKSTITDDIHFICIDNRIVKNNKTYITLQNGQTVIMHPNITKVPALYLIKQAGRIIYGNDIYNFFKPKQEFIKKKTTQNNGEPLAFVSNEMGNEMSDNYAYLDLSPEDLSAKGEGGLRQLHRFSLLQTDHSIETPPEDYSPDKIGEVDMESLQRKRASEII